MAPPSGSPATSPVSRPTPDSPGPRRSQRTTFGQHSNPFRLPYTPAPPPLPPALEPSTVAETATFQSRGECSRRVYAGLNPFLAHTPQFPLPPEGGSSAPISASRSSLAGKPRPLSPIKGAGAPSSPLATQPEERKVAKSGQYPEGLWIRGSLVGGRQSLFTVADPPCMSGLWCHVEL